MAEANRLKHNAIVALMESKNFQVYSRELSVILSISELEAVILMESLELDRAVILSKSSSGICIIPNSLTKSILIDRHYLPKPPPEMQRIGF